LGSAGSGTAHHGTQALLNGGPFYFPMQNQTWNTALYDGKHAFVAKFGEDVLALLAPKPGETILDVGCGTGSLTAKIAECGATVIGLDSSAEMIAKARAEHPDMLFVERSITAFDEPPTFDAIFSNATLHWVTDAAGAVRAMARALKPGGRFVAEFGGHGNIGGIAQAVRAALNEITGRDIPHGWYFPTVGEYAALLEQHGLAVSAAWLFDRPTRLDGADGMRNWITMFGGGLFTGVSDPEIKKRAIDLAEARLFATHFKDNAWYADYRRIRVVAAKTAA
jgi:trans-aconitate methyltransferase